MERLTTIYGVLEGVLEAVFYESGELKECMLHEYNELETSHGILIPQYENGEVRRKYTKSLSFYKNGKLKSISLHQQTNIQTAVGCLPAELLTFYESGTIKRLFPLNGKLTGYWTEENEFDMAPILTMSFPFGEICEKIISIYFYETKEIKSLTFWPNHAVSIQSPLGMVETRIGVSLYPDGKLKGLEPVKPLEVQTPIGNIMAYDVGALGIHGESSSLCLDPTGHIRSLKSSTDRIEVTDREGAKHVFEPRLKPNLFNPKIMDIVPIEISFEEDFVHICNEQKYKFKISEHVFQITPFVQNIYGSCGACAGCTACM